MDNPVFPCTKIPEDGPAAKLLGLGAQRQDGCSMQRVRIHGGRLSAAQWRALADLATGVTPGTPLHLTTRQDIEFHNVAPADIPRLHRGLADAGLTTVGACGDTLRNVTVCPSCAAAADHTDLHALAAAISTAAASLPGAFRLPRKFKISLSACAAACARPWINDLGFVALGDGGFRVIGAGSLGAKPETGAILYQQIAPGEVVPLAIAALRLFEAEGDREHRSRARLRHVRERLGNEEFARRLDALFQDVKRSRPPDNPPAPPAGTSCGFDFGWLRFSIPGGELDPALLPTLVDAVEMFDGDITVGFEHDLRVRGLMAGAVPQTLRPFLEGPRVVACAGMAWCRRAVTDPARVAERIRRDLPKGCMLQIAVSGCANGCSHTAVAEIGLVGGLRSSDDGREPVYRILVGGGGGRTDALAREEACGLDEDSAVAAVLDRVRQTGAGTP